MIPTARPPFSPERILFPTDFSPSACAALATAEGLALQFKAELYLMNVIPMLPIVANLDFPTPLFPQQEYLQDARNDATKRLAAIDSALASKSIRSSSCVEIDNDVVGTILMVIEREHIDMLIISTHGMSGWKPVIFGSIADKVVKLVECPLLLLRSPKEEL